MLTCKRCGVRKQRRGYDPDVLRNHTADDRVLVCIECYELRYSSRRPHGISTFHCAAGHDWGHLAFETQLLWNVLRAHTLAKVLICKECREKPTYKCSISLPSNKQHECYEWNFAETMIKSFKRQKAGTSRLVCNNCCGRGFSTQHRGDIPRQCYRCHEWLGPQKFDLKNDAKKVKIMCKDCKQKPQTCSPT